MTFSCSQRPIKCGIPLPDGKQKKDKGTTKADSLLKNEVVSFL
jgi:hypothetical protein